MRVRVPGVGSAWPQVPSKEIIGTERPFHEMVPKYHAGAPSILSGCCQVTTSATQVRGTIKRSSVSGTNRAYSSWLEMSFITKPFYAALGPAAQSHPITDYLDKACRD